MASRPTSEPRTAGADARAEDEDSQWVRSFLRTRPGKTYRVDGTDDAREDAAREALAAAARTLIDRVLQGSQGAVGDDEPTSGPS